MNVTRFIYKEELHCVACGKKGVWLDQDVEVAYEPSTYACKSCRAIFDLGSMSVWPHGSYTDNQTIKTLTESTATQPDAAPRPLRGG